MRPFYNLKIMRDGEDPTQAVAADEGLPAAFRMAGAYVEDDPTIVRIDIRAETCDFPVVARVDVRHEDM